MTAYFTENHFNRLKPEEAEALAILSEECGELIQAIGKIMRHGLGSKHPDSNIQNQDALVREIGDVLAAIRICRAQRLIEWDAIIAARDQKLNRVRQYLHHAKVTVDE